MALLFAQLEHQIRRTITAVGRAIVEKATGFSDPTGHQLPDDDELYDWQRDLSSAATDDHTGYYEKTPTCGQEKPADIDVTHGCYGAPGHNGDHVCLCGHTWPPTVPAGVRADDPTSAAPPAGLTWAEQIVPVIQAVLTEHQYLPLMERCRCPARPSVTDLQDWHDHVAPKIADRINAAMLGPDALAANERIAAALRAAGFQEKWPVPSICSAIFNHK